MRPLSEALAPRSIARRPELGAAAALLLLLLFNALFTPGFLEVEQRDGRFVGALIDILQNGVPTMLVALGMTLVIASGAIDLSVGSTMALAATVAAMFLEGRAPNDLGAAALAFGAALAAGALVGGVNALLVNLVRLPPVVATLATMATARGAAQMLSGDQKLPLVSTGIEWLANGPLAGLPVPLAILALIALLLTMVARGTALRLHLASAGGNARAARLAGLPVAGVRTAAFILCGMLAALAGVLVAGDIALADVSHCGLGMELDAILAVALGGTLLRGGTPRLVGSLLGATVMRLLSASLLMHGVLAEQTLVVKGAAVVAVCLLQSRATRDLPAASSEAEVEPRRSTLLGSLALLAALGLMLGFRYYSMGFLSVDTLVNLISDRAVLGVVAIGAAFVILSGGIDLSVGAVMGLASVLLARLLTDGGVPLWLALPATLAFGALFGAAQGALIHRSRVPAFIITLAGLFIARGVAFIINLEPQSIRDEGHAALAALGLRVGGAFIPITALVLGAVVLLGQFMLSRTSFGRHVVALGGDEESARLLGVPVAATRIAVYSLSGFCAALGGVLLTLVLSSSSHVDGVGLELDAIAAVVIGGVALSGGVGSISGVFIGVLILGLVTGVIPAYEGSLSSGATRVAVGVLLTLFVAARQSTLRARR